MKAKRKTGKQRVQMYAMGNIVGDEPKPKVYTTQAEVDAANKFAKGFATRRGLVSGENTYVATKPGDPVVKFTGEVETSPTVNKAFSVPYWVEQGDIQQEGNDFYYQDRESGKVNYIDTSVFNTNPKFRKPVEVVASDLLNRNTAVNKAPVKFAGGGQAGATNNPWLGIANMIPGMADSLIDVLENNPKAYSRQPIINPTSMRTMVSPYNHFAMGGVSMEESGFSEDQLAQLQSMADEQGISVEELIQMLQGQERGEDMSNQEAQETLDLEQEEDGTFAYGGKSGRRKIEVEGKEALETPDGQLAVVKGPSHEDGGVDMDVPDGTKIYSDRIKIDNKTMKQRKLTREKAVARLVKLAEKNPFDKLLRGTIQRTIEVTDKEEQQDMAIQKVASAVYNMNNQQQPEQEFAMGGQTNRHTYAYGDEVANEYGGNGTDPGDPYAEYIKKILGIPARKPVTVPMRAIPPNQDWRNLGSSYTNMNRLPAPNPIRTKTNQAPINNKAASRLNSIKNSSVFTDTEDKQATPDKMGSKLTAGDYVGIGGNLFNAIAPLLNTEANADAMKPNVNRFRGFGKDAIDSNSAAQSVAARLKANGDTDISTSTESARRRTRNSTTSVNTLRAFDTATDITESKARQANNDSFAKQMIGLMSQKSQLENLQDKMEMTGETARDIEDKADMDNYFSNKAQNLVNFGTNVQGIGKALNTSKSNKVNANLVSQLSQYGLGFDNDGNLISVR